MLVLVPQQLLIETLVVCWQGLPLSGDSDSEANSLGLLHPHGLGSWVGYALLHLSGRLPSPLSVKTEANSWYLSFGFNVTVDDSVFL